jgi:hypothetical protein
VIDARLVREKFRLVAARFLTQGSRCLAPSIERRTRCVEIAMVNKREGLLPDHCEFRSVVPQAAELSSQFDELVSQSVKARGDFEVWHTALAELCKNGKQRCCCDSLVACDLVGERR